MSRVNVRPRIALHGGLDERALSCRMTVEIKPCQEIYPDYARGAAAAAPSFRYVYGVSAL